MLSSEERQAIINLAFKEASEKAADFVLNRAIPALGEAVERTKRFGNATRTNTKLINQRIHKIQSGKPVIPTDHITTSGIQVAERKYGVQAYPEVALAGKNPAYKNFSEMDRTNTNTKIKSRSDYDQADFNQHSRFLQSGGWGPKLGPENRATFSKYVRSLGQDQFFKNRG